MVSVRVFVRFLATYLLLILLPLGIGTYLVQRLVDEYEKKVTESQIALLNQGRDGIEDLMRDVEWQTYQISGNPKLLRFLSSTGEGARRDAFLMKEIVDDLNSYLLYSNMITSTFYVYCPLQDTVFTPYSIYHTDDFVDGKTFFNMPGISSDGWHALVMDAYHRGSVYPSRLVTIEDFKNRAMIPYLQSIPLGYLLKGEDVEAAVVFLIGEDEIAAHLEALGLPRDGYAYIADGTGTVLTAFGGEREEIEPWQLPRGSRSGAFWTEDRNGLIVYSSSELNGWQYVAVLPARWAFRAVTSLQRMTFIGLLGSLVVSMGMALVLAYRRSESLGHVFRQIREVLDVESPAPFDYKSIDLGVSRLIERNAAMQQELGKQRELVFSNFLNRLLNGYYRNPQSLVQFGGLLGLGEQQRSFTVLSIVFNGEIDLESPDVIDQLNKVKVVLKTELQGRFPGPVWIYDASEERIACVCVSSAPGGRSHAGEETVRRARDLASVIERIYPRGISVGIGSTVDALVEVHRSYSEAREAELHCSPDDGNGCRTFRDIERSLDTYRYPIEQEVRLMNAVSAGDAATVDQVMDQVLIENFAERQLPDEKARFLLFELRSTLAKMVSQLKLQASDYPVRDHGEYRLDVEQLRSIFLDICSLTESKKRSHNSRLIRAILDYLDENFTDRNLSLASVATEFSITESYLSFFFKEQTGENFSANIERRRIEKAAELLGNSDASVLDVARECGYNSDKTFRRVFRRVRGLSPSEYRENRRQRRTI